MPTTSAINNFLGPDGAIARRLGERFESRPQQMEMAEAVERAFTEKHHLLVEAGTGVGKSFAYLLPAIDFAVKHKKRVVISTHTISLQEQLIEKDIPLIRSVYPDEFTAVLVKGRSNYLCQRRLEQSRSRQSYLFDREQQLESLWTIEEWAQQSIEKGGLGSLAELPQLPDPAVWEKVCAEHGNCLGKKCKFYRDCFWQSAKRRMQGANILIVNHALFFSDLGLRMAGVNYLPKYDLVILDEAHTVEDVAGQHFGVRISESSIRYNLRSLYDIKRGRGMLSTHGGLANDAIRIIVELNDVCDGFFDRVIAWQKSSGRGNGRVHEKDVVPNDLSPKLNELAKHLRGMSTSILLDAEETTIEARQHAEAEASELNASADKVTGMAEAINAIVGQTIPDTVYWFDVNGTRAPQKVSLHAAPVNVAEGLKRQLFDVLPSVVMTSATLCTAGSRTTGILPVGARATGPQSAPTSPATSGYEIRQGAHLPHWRASGATYAVTVRLADSLPQHVLRAWSAERDEIPQRATQVHRDLTPTEVKRLCALHSEKYQAALDAGHGECLLNRPDVAHIVIRALLHRAGERYRLLAWTLMPNHVHVLLEPAEGMDLSKILHSWKSFSAKQINASLGREGQVWQVEYYDRVVRDDVELDHHLEYIWNNPENAGLENWNQRWRADDAAAGFDLSVLATSHGQDARGTKGFEYITSRLGVTKCETLQLGSPFDYSSQATLYLETSLPEPNDANRFLPLACDRILHYLDLTNGGAFVLFTSYKMLIDAANRLKPQLDELGLPLLVQGQGAPRKVLLDRFRSLDNAVLFGTSSFWQGIDVQGDKLRNVIITKLPFDVPDEPVIEARLEAITRRGGNAFMELSVPQAVIKLKQGFGRLIRSKTDKGIVVILDSRVKTKRYGKLFLDALPTCRVRDVNDGALDSPRSEAP